VDKESKGEFKEWLMGVKKNMIRTIFQRVMRAGESFDHSSSEMYPALIGTIKQRLAQINTIESIKRKHDIGGLQISTGR
jgi:ribosomal protein L29